MLDEKLIDLLEEFSSLNEKINENMCLYHDLKIYGDDADELISRYSKMFNVSIANFRFKDYFPFEGDEFLLTVIRFLTGKKRQKLKRLTVAHLQRAIELKELI